MFTVGSVTMATWDRQTDKQQTKRACARNGKKEEKQGGGKRNENYFNMLI